MRSPRGGVTKVRALVTFSLYYIGFSVIDICMALAVAHVRERQLVARRNVGHKGLSKGAQDICEFLRVSINTQGIYKLPRPKLRSYKYLEHLAVHEVELDVHALHVKEATKWSAARAMHEP